MDFSSVLQTHLVWSRGQLADGYDAREFRRDHFGNLIKFSDYGDRSAPFGWEIDHIQPSALGGGDTLENLRPLSCQTNASLGGIIGQQIAQNKAR